MISVIMSVYKEKVEWLKKSIDSILNQTFNDFEFIITLDNPDNVELKSIIEEYQRKDKRIKVIINEENKGLVWSLNNMIAISKGEYIARMDADDISDKNRLKKQLTYLEEKNIDILGTDIIVFDKEKKFRKHLHENDIDIKENIGKGSFIPHPTWLVRKKVFIELKGYRNIYSAEDYDFILRAIKHGYILGNYPEPLLQYRINMESISRKNAYKQKLTSNYLDDNFNNIDEIRIEDLENYISKRLKDEEKYSKGEQTLYKFKAEKNIFKKIYYLFLLFFKYYVYLKNNKMRNVINKIKSKFNFRDKQYMLIIKHYIKIYLFPIIRSNKKIKLESYKKNIYLIDVPQFRNLGDHAIAKAERLFFEKNYKDYNVVEIPIDEYEINYLNLKRNIKNDDIIILVGGGNFGVEYYIMELHRREIIQNFKNKIILFPQTIYFGYSEFGLKQLKKSSELYSKNTNLIMFAREEKSYNIMKYYFKNNSYLVPDIVLSMKIDDNKFERDKILLCLRNDIEGCLDSKDINDVYKILKEYKYESYDTVIKNNVLLKDRDEELKKCYNKFLSSKLVITDRLHGMIFSAITSTPCLVLKNYNYKVESVYNTWLKNIDYIKFIQDKENLNIEIDKFIKKDYEEINYIGFEKEFENMNRIICSFIKENNDDDF